MSNDKFQKPLHFEHSVALVLKETMRNIHLNLFTVASVQPDCRCFGQENAKCTNLAFLKISIDMRGREICNSAAIILNQRAKMHQTSPWEHTIS